MSVNYGGPPAGGMPYGGGGAGYAPPGKVNFGWISEAFTLFQANIAVWIVAGLLSLVPIIFGAIIGAIAGASGAATTGAYAPDASNPGAALAQRLGGGLNPGVSLIIRVVAAIYGAWLYGGVYRAAIKQVRGEPISTADLFTGVPTMWSMLGFSVVYGLATGVGFVLCIVPGLLAAGLLFPGYALIADGESFGNALSRSIDGMKRDMWMAAAFVFVLGLLIAVSAIPCGLGLFVTVPVFYLTGALAYRDMIGMPTGAGGGGYGQPGFGAPAAPGVWPPAPSVAPPPTDTPPASSYGQSPPPTSFGQTPPPASQTPPPAPSWGQPQPPATPPANPEPPRRSLGGDPVDETPPPGGGPQ